MINRTIERSWLESTIGWLDRDLYVALRKTMPFGKYQGYYLGDVRLLYLDNIHRTLDSVMLQSAIETILRSTLVRIWYQRNKLDVSFFQLAGQTAVHEDLEFEEDESLDSLIKRLRETIAEQDELLNSQRAKDRLKSLAYRLINGTLSQDDMDFIALVQSGEASFDDLA